MRSQPTQDDGGSVATVPAVADQLLARDVERAQADADGLTGYELLVCRGCGRHGAPRPASVRHHTVPCPGCGTNDYRRLAIVALEPDELELLIELAERVVSSEGVLEKLYAERRYVAIDGALTAASHG